jgi:hypothetical protein
MIDPLENQRDGHVDSTVGSDGSVEDQRTPWHRPVVTRIPLARTLSAVGSNVDGHTGSVPT